MATVLTGHTTGSLAATSATASLSTLLPSESQELVGLC
jgi:hypothetical protein